VVHYKYANLLGGGMNAVPLSFPIHLGDWDTCSFDIAAEETECPGG